MYQVIQSWTLFSAVSWCLSKHVSILCYCLTNTLLIEGIVSSKKLIGMYVKSQALIIYFRLENHQKMDNMWTSIIHTTFILLLSCLWATKMCNFLYSNPFAPHLASLNVPRTMHEELHKV